MLRRAALLGIVCLAACSRPVPPSPPASVREKPGSNPLVVSDPVIHRLRVCVVEGGEPREIEIDYHIVTGDSTVHGRPFRKVYPVDGRYAEGQPFYARHEPIVVGGRRYAKYGLTRELGIGEVERVGEFDGVGVYAARGDTMPASVYYLPVRPGCVFQPYQNAYDVGAVRG